MARMGLFRSHPVAGSSEARQRSSLVLVMHEDVKINRRALRHVGTCRDADDDRPADSRQYGSQIS